MKKLLIWEFADDFTPAEYFSSYDPCEECRICPFFVWNDEMGSGECICCIANGSKQPDDEELKLLGVEERCQLYDLFYE